MTSAGATSRNGQRGFIAAFSNRLKPLLETIERNARNRLPGGLLYESADLGLRLTQEICILIEVPLRREDARRAIEGLAPLQFESPEFSCAGVKVDARSGRIGIGPRLWLAGMARFAALWSAMLWLGLRALGTGDARRAMLVHGVPEEGLFRENDTEFAAFCRSGPIAPLNEAELLYVQSLSRTPVSSAPDRIRYARHPLFECMRRSGITVGQFLFFLRRHLTAGTAYLTGAVRMPALAVLWRDYACHAVAESLNARDRLHGVMVTNTNWNRQLLWMNALPKRRYEAHMVLYSQHDRQPDYIDEPEHLRGHPTVHLVRVDHFWVWTPGYAAAVTRDGTSARVHVVGPILWEPDRRARLPRSVAWISVFDIAPLVPDVNIRDYGLLDNYFSPDNASAFLDGILRAVRAAGLQLPVVIKPKRRPDPLRDPGYQARLQESREFELLDSDAPITEVVSRSAVVIVYPFSSAAFVADWMAVPAIYFDPTGKVARAHELGAHIAFARSSAELESLLRSIDKPGRAAGRWPVAESAIAGP